MLKCPECGSDRIETERKPNSASRCVNCGFRDFTVYSDVPEGPKELSDMSTAELVAECNRREKVANNIWAAIVSVYGPEGFTAVLKKLESRGAHL